MFYESVSTASPTANATCRAAAGSAAPFEAAGGQPDVSEIQIRNVICNYSLPMHVDLRRVAMMNGNVTLDRSRGVLYKQKRNPQCHVKVYSSGSVYIVGCRSEDECRRAARSVGRMVQRSMGKLETPIRLRDYKICNMLSTYKLPFGVKIEEMAKKYPKAIYEPELSVGLTWKFDHPKSSLRIHTTGSITVTGTTSTEAVYEVIRLIYPIVQEFQCPLRVRDPIPTGNPRRRRAPPSSVPRTAVVRKQPRKTAPRAPALKTQVCVIEKNMSTILTALVCYFYDPEKFRAANRSVNREVFNKRFCARKNEAFSFMGRVYHGLNKTAEWFHLAVSREPIERFISGFADKCLIEKIFTKRRGTCNGCRGNVTCFLEKEFDRMQRFSRGETRLNSFDDRHFYPQNWRCTEAFYRDFFDAIRTRNATESDVRFVEEQVKNGQDETHDEQLGRAGEAGEGDRHYYGGIPVPGRRVPTLRFFEFYIASCDPAQRKDISLSKCCTEWTPEAIAEKVFRQLSFTVDDLEVEPLMGRWFTVVDSPGLHAEKCVVSEFRLESKTKYTATFSVVQKSRNEDVVTYTGHGEKIGTDPGNVFVHTGHPHDPCPYFPVKVGPPSGPEGKFEYVVLTQPLKHPTMVLARDPLKFEREFRKEVEEYLKRSDFLNPLAALNHPLQFINQTACRNGHQFHYSLDDE
ncbi:TATA box-binding protein-like 1 [Aphelenchoides fujianensis]|nr:TATA box-binding protein-like 1 [Aphelenchoides fujianensis]